MIANHRRLVCPRSSWRLVDRRSCCQRRGSGEVAALMIADGLSERHLKRLFLPGMITRFEDGERKRAAES